MLSEFVGDANGGLQNIDMSQFPICAIDETFHQFFNILLLLTHNEDLESASEHIIPYTDMCYVLHYLILVLLSFF